ncbi:MAG: aldo/keto reductase [Spirochaetales bacterium]|uniref:aldo/keto reductase n=1 Tax=Bullifex sp. TaxID=2815808 RepID=UPI002A57126F|nr:aldo/keto reductase [Bullifex sp.]MDD5972661.1 aldo/keto reductase [Spirochaetales bacterium]MDD7271183.1 aldo/keto reductase [Spirochaetales bacterium]MDY4067697.1 aldo/keto reductase [Bullifex sp.]
MYIASENRYQEMIYSRCGDSGLKLPRVSLGLWHNFGSNAKEDDIKDIIFTAFDNGITHFDLANNYGPYPGAAESNFGRLLSSHLKNYRDELIISTKAGYEMYPGPYGDGGSRKYLFASLDQSLKRLNLDYVDIFYHHRMDKSTPLEETMLALADIVRSGRALYVGLSNYDGKTLEEANEILTRLNVPFIINQNSYNLFNRTIEKNGLKETSYRLRKGIISFSPLAQGLLTDRYIDGIPNDSRAASSSKFLNSEDITVQKLDVIKKLNAHALQRGETLSEMALKWVLKDDKVTSVLVGVSKSSQLLKNIKAASGNLFTLDELNIIEEIVKPVVY